VRAYFKRHLLYCDLIFSFQCAVGLYVNIIVIQTAWYRRLVIHGSIVAPLHTETSSMNCIARDSWTARKYCRMFSVDNLLATCNQRKQQQPILCNITLQ